MAQAATLFKAAILVEVDEPDSVAVVAFFLEYGCLGGEFLIKAAHPRAMQILELLLEVVGICLGQKGHFWVFLPTGEGSFSPASRMRLVSASP
nr:hypothetical protein [Aeromonas caviae]